jgi:hypothetical protein
MKNKWMFLLLVAVLTVNTWKLTFRLEDPPTGSTTHWKIWQEATPQPQGGDLGEFQAPRPPSEAGQNMVLIVGAAMLVLIVFLGVALHARERSRETTNRH